MNYITEALQMEAIILRHKTISPLGRCCIINCGTYCSPVSSPGDNN